MPDFEKCISHEGKVYCWNKATRKIAVVDIRDLDFKDCPDYVIQAFIEGKKEAVDAK